MVRSQQWKEHERRTAKALQGVRIPRGANFSDSLPDVVANAKGILARAEGIIYAECKYSINNPWVDYISSIYDNKLLRIDNLIFFSLEDIWLLSDPTRVGKSKKVTKKKIPKYLRDYLEQSKKYIDLVSRDPILKLIIATKSNCTKTHINLPIVCVGKRYNSFKLTYTGIDDILNFYQLQNDQSYRKI